MLPGDIKTAKEMSSWSVLRELYAINLNSATTRMVPKLSEKHIFFFRNS